MSTNQWLVTLLTITLLTINCLVVGCQDGESTTRPRAPLTESHSRNQPAGSTEQSHPETNTAQPVAEPSTVAVTDFDGNGDASQSDATNAVERRELPLVQPNSESAEQPAEWRGTESLWVGDPAPPLEVAEWMQGDPLASWEPGKVHVIEFWATWCPPCVRSMPHLSQLQRHYADRVNVIGVSDEQRDTIQSFIQQEQDGASGRTWGQAITYRIARDGEGSPMGTHYMQAAEQNNIPTAFIVGVDGRIQWIGHPMRIDGPLKSVIEGTWDLARAAAQFRGERIAENLQETISPLVSEARRSGDWSSVVAQLDHAINQHPQLVRLKQLKLTVLILAEKFAEAQTLAEQISTDIWDDPAVLNDVAWMVVSRIPAERLDYGLLIRMTNRAAELTQFENASILDTLARVFYEQGNLGAAIQWQQRALAAPDQGNRDRIKRQLERYQSERKDTKQQPAET